MKDLSLIVYTLAIQAAVGIYVVSRIVLWSQTAKAERTRYLWLVAGLGVVGVLTSVTHLGYPMNAFKTMSNLGTSWLSREILFTAGFGVAGVVSLIMERQEVGSTQSRNGWGALTSLLGLCLVFVMSMIYRTTAFTAWTTVITTISFFATAGLIGTAAVFAGQCLQKGNEEPNGLTGLMIGALALLAVQVGSVAAHGVYLGAAGPEAQATAALISGKYAALYWARIIFVVIGAAIFMPLAWRQWAQRKAAGMPQIAGALVALVGLGEVMGRILFYATRVKIGL